MIEVDKSVSPFWSQRGIPERIARDDEHRYGPGLFPSVTTVLSLRTDPYLDAWRRRQVASETEKLITDKLLGTKKISKQAVIKRAIEKPDDVGRSAAQIGTIVHEYILENQELPDLNAEDMKKVMNAISGWNEFVSVCGGFQFMTTEHALVGEIDGMPYGGTIDAIIRIPSRMPGHPWSLPKMILMDLKTSARLGDGYAMQAAAYTHLWNQNGGLPLDSTWVVRVDKNRKDTYECMPVNVERSLAAWKSLLAYYYHDKESERYWDR